MKNREKLKFSLYKTRQLQRKEGMSSSRATSFISHHICSIGVLVEAYFYRYCAIKNLNLKSVKVLLMLIFVTSVQK